MNVQCSENGEAKLFEKHLVASHVSYSDTASSNSSTSGYISSCAFLTICTIALYTTAQLCKSALYTKALFIQQHYSFDNSHFYATALSLQARSSYSSTAIQQQRCSYSNSDLYTTALLYNSALYNNSALYTATVLFIQQRSYTTVLKQTHCGNQGKRMS